MKIVKLSGRVSGYGVVLNQRIVKYKGKDYRQLLVAKMLGKDGFRCQKPETRWISEYWVREDDINNINNLVVRENKKRLLNQIERFFSKTDYFHSEYDKFTMDQDLTLMKQFEGRKYEH